MADRLDQPRAKFDAGSGGQGRVAAESSRLGALRRRMPLWLGIGAAVAVAVGVAGDAPKVGAALLSFRWELVPAILLLTMLNYLLRFVKWNYYLRLIDAPPMPRSESAMIFFGGLAMTMTPGKVGEWLKSFLLRERHGVPVSVSAPIILAERLTDGLAMLLLALGGLFAYGYGRELLAVVALGAVALIVLTQVRAVPLAVLGWMEGMPVLGTRAHHARAFFESTHLLLRLPPLLLAVGLGTLSWGGECVAFYLVLVGLGVPATPELLLQSAFILATATIVGSVSMLPGGLAVAEGSLAGMLLFLGVTAEPARAAAATLLIRFGTLWFGVLLGIVALLGLDRRPTPAHAPRREKVI